VHRIASRERAQCVVVALLLLDLCRDLLAQHLLVASSYIAILIATSRSA
jgi:hypothetical protein